MPGTVVFDISGKPRAMGGIVSFIVALLGFWAAHFVSIAQLPSGVCAWASDHGEPTILTVGAPYEAVYRIVEHSRPKPGE